MKASYTIQYLFHDQVVMPQLTTTQPHESLLDPETIILILIIIITLTLVGREGGRGPSISHKSMRRAVSAVVYSIVVRTLKHGYSRWNFVAIVY